MATPSDPNPETIVLKAQLAPGAASKRPRPRLTSIHGSALGKRWSVDACGVVIGRDPARASLVLADPAISARHCALELDTATGEFTLSDLGSRNGTYVNGEKVTERRVSAGDKLFVGETVLEFSLDDDLPAGFRCGIDARVDRDVLTGLLMKRVFDLELSQVFARARSESTPLSLLMMEVGELEPGDAQRGNKAAALCVAEVGRIIREEIAGVGFACRFATSGFLACLHPVALEGAEPRAERIRARISAYSFERDGAQVQSTVGIGIAQLAPDLPTPDHLLQLADEALFRAKRAGQNQVSR